MNIFYTDSDPVKAAQSLVDRHVIKMILETCQLLCTAHRVLDGTEITQKVYVNGSFPARYRKKKVWMLNDHRESQLYSATHVNHPSAVWVRKSNNNYNWLYAHLLALLEEYTHRYGKRHKCADLVGVLMSPPQNIQVTHFTQPTPAMDAKYIISESSVINYRNYYKLGKQHLHRWTRRNPPEWIDTVKVA